MIIADMIIKLYIIKTMIVFDRLSNNYKLPK